MATETLNGPTADGSITETQLVPTGEPPEPATP